MRHMEAKIVIRNQQPYVDRLLDMQADLGLSSNSFVTIVLLEDIMLTRNIF